MEGGKPGLSGCYHICAATLVCQTTNILRVTGLATREGGFGTRSGTVVELAARVASKINLSWSAFVIDSVEVYTELISPAIGCEIWFLMVSVLASEPSRNMSLVTAASVVKSRPDTTPRRESSTLVS